MPKELHIWICICLVVHLTLQGSFAVMSSVKVAVRVRPFNNREMQRDCTCIIDMTDKMTSTFYCTSTVNVWHVHLRSRFLFDWSSFLQLRWFRLNTKRQTSVGIIRFFTGWIHFLLPDQQNSTVWYDTECLACTEKLIGGQRNLLCGNEKR